LLVVGNGKKKLIVDIENVVNKNQNPVDRDIIDVWNEFRMCEQFHRFPRSGGYERQNPKKMETFRIINNAIAEYEQRQKDKEKLRRM
jgi:hypothetical protein